MDASAFPSKWFKNLVINDELYVAAIDNLLLDFKKTDSSITPNLAGVTKTGGRWIPIEGTHSLTFEDKSNINAISLTEDKKRCYKLELSGKTAIKVIYRILNPIRITIHNDAFISVIDNWILHEQSLINQGNYVADVVSVPMDGIYTLVTKGQDGYMVIKRETVKDKKTYTIDIVGKFYDDKLKMLLYGNANRIKVVHCTILNQQINVRLMNKLPLDDIYNGQKVVVDYVVNTYQSKKTKNVSVLISGPTGLGKSTIALLVAQKIKSELDVDPFLIKGFNVMADEMQYHPVIGHYSPMSNSPIILLLDEFDLAMKEADSPAPPNGRKDGLAIAANKTNLNNFLDAINDESFLIVIATTNTAIADLNATYGVYCRKGRFDKHFEMVSKDVTNMFDPIN